MRYTLKSIYLVFELFLIFLLLSFYQFVIAIKTVFVVVFF